MKFRILNNEEQIVSMSREFKCPYTISKVKLTNKLTEKILIQGKVFKKKKQVIRNNIQMTNSRKED